MVRVVSRDIIILSPARSFISIVQLALLGPGYEITATGFTWPCLDDTEMRDTFSPSRIKAEFHRRILTQTTEGYTAP